MSLRAFALLFAVAFSASAQTPSPGAGKVLAVLEFDSKLEGGERKAVDVGYLSDTVRGAALDEIPTLRVMTKENVLVLLGANGKTLEDCQGECEVETGRKLGADLVISGALLKFGSSFKLNLKLHDTHEGRLLAGTTASGKSIDDLDTATNEAVHKLLRPLVAQLGGPAGSAPAPLVRQAQPETHAAPLVTPAAPAQSERTRGHTRPAEEPPTQRFIAEAAPPRDQDAERARASGEMPTPRHVDGARPLLTIATSSGSKTFTVVAAVEGRSFKCEQPVTLATPCTLAGVPEGKVSIAVTGDAQSSTEVKFAAENLQISIEPRGKWPLGVAIPSLLVGTVFIVVGAITDSNTSSNAVGSGVQAMEYAYGGIFLATGVGFLIFQAVRSSVGFSEETSKVAQGETHGLQLASIALAPVPGGVAGGALFRF